MSCEKLSRHCDEDFCECARIREDATDTGLRKLAAERGLTVLTNEQVKAIRDRFFSAHSSCAYAQSELQAAIRELEGGK